MLDSMLVDESVAAHVAERDAITRPRAGHSYSVTGSFPSSPFHDQ